MPYSFCVFTVEEQCSGYICNMTVVRRLRRLRLGVTIPRASFLVEYNYIFFFCCFDPIHLRLLGFVSGSRFDFPFV